MKIWIQHFCSRLSIIYPVLPFLMIFALVLPVMAAMPPENYTQKAKQSKIKAIATIETVETLDIGRYYSTKKVTFRLEYALSKDTPKIFNGYCKSVETAIQRKNTIEGGEIYFYPNPGQRVYVTVYHDDGNITTMTPVTVELEKGIRQTPDKIRYVMGSAHIQDNPKELSKNKPLVLLQTKWAGKDPLHNTGNSELNNLDKELKTLETLGMDVHGTPEEEMQGQLLVALGNDDKIEVYQLLKNGARINKPFNSSGQTPLMAAESLAMVKLLCKKGADTTLKDAEGGTVLHYAVSRKAAVEMIPYLISHGANINEKGWDNETPLFAAASYFNEMHWPQPNHPMAKKVIELLTISGADLNTVDDYGNTILMQCTVAKNTDLVELLLKLGADKARQNKGGQTARDIAYDMGHRYLYQMLD